MRITGPPSVYTGRSTRNKGGLSVQVGGLLDPYATMAAVEQGLDPAVG